MGDSAADSAEWSGEETEESVSEGESDTAGGRGMLERRQRRQQRDRMEVAQKPFQGAQRPAEAPHRRRPPWKQTQRVWGGRHGAEKQERERVASRRENPYGKSSGVGDREGDPKASRVAEIPGGDRQGAVGGV